MIRPVVELTCPEHLERLSADAGEAPLECPRGCRFTYVRGVPRFVSSDNYAAPFGSQWKTFRRTQLDSFTGTTISLDRLARCLGQPLGSLRGKLVLEAGCGAGRFTELLLRAGARVFACDLSDAVEANYENCKNYPGYFVCQADIAKLPMAPGLFDFVICLGVVQHTPHPETTLRMLAANLKPGGLLVVDHYTGHITLRPMQDRMRRLLLKRHPRFTLAFCRALTSILWPLHRLCWRLRNTRSAPVAKLRAWFLNTSPILDYQYSYPSLGNSLLKSWAILDTHDALTDFYKHSRTAEQIDAALRELGLTEIVVAYGGNGVEARARRPAATQP